MWTGGFSGVGALWWCCLWVVSLWFGLCLLLGFMLGKFVFVGGLILLCCLVWVGVYSWLLL